MPEIVQIKIPGLNKTLYYDVTNLKVKKGDYCIMEVEKNVEYGQVISQPETISAKEMDGEPLRQIMRLAAKEDIAKIQDNKRKAKEAFQTCFKKIKEHKLDMKLIEAVYSFNCSKIIFYFTAEERIDFRELVKDLAHIFRARIEMCQIGVRDEAKILGGFGPCGRNLCCAKFLKDFEPVTIKMAKEQNLPLNPSKISGVCGRLMCCLAYEYETYKELMRDMPKMGERMNTKEGKGKVVAVNPLKRTVTVELEEGRQIEISYPKK